MGPDPVTGVLRRRRDGDTRESHVKTQGKDGPPKQGRETSLADADQTSTWLHCIARCQLRCPAPLPPGVPGPPKPGTDGAPPTRVGLQPHLGSPLPRRIPGGPLHSTATLTPIRASHSRHTPAFGSESRRSLCCETQHCEHDRRVRKAGRLAGAAGGRQGQWASGGAAGGGAGRLGLARKQGGQAAKV